MSNRFAQRIFSFGVLAIFLLISRSAYPETSEKLSCFEFQSILYFIEKQHLRFESMSAVERSKLLDTALSETPKALRILGLPMLAAQFENLQFKKISVATQKRSGFEICELMENTTFRGAFLKAYAKHLDPYSDFYLTEELDAKASALEGEFVGVGIATEPTAEGLRVIEVVPAGPADQKLFVGDQVLAIDGRSVLGLNEMEVRQRIRGDKGSVVRFSGLRASKAFETAISRDIVHQRSVTSTWLDNKVLNIRIHRFFRQTASEVEALVRSDGSRARGFILDLRNNPGGLLQGARDIVDLFVSEGVVVYLRGRGVEDQIWALHEGGELTKPVVVLVNEGTASAAEIVAGALQDYGRAVLVGQKTYGKGSVQNIYETQSALGTQYRGGLKLTTLWYYLPSGRSVRSLDPDVKLASVAKENEFAHPSMPYSGPERIQVADHLAISPLKHFDFKQASPVIEPSQDSEQVGRALLLKMLAGSPSKIE